MAHLGITERRSGWRRALKRPAGVCFAGPPWFFTPFHKQTSSSVRRWDWCAARAIHRWQLCLTFGALVIFRAASESRWQKVGVFENHSKILQAEHRKPKLAFDFWESAWAKTVDEFCFRCKFGLGAQRRNGFLLVILPLMQHSLQDPRVGGVQGARCPETVASKGALMFQPLSVFRVDPVVPVGSFGGVVWIGGLEA